MIRLIKMTEKEFEKIKGKMIADHAKNKIKAGHWMESEAYDLSKEAFEHILKEGINTENHFILKAEKDEAVDIGYIWINVFRNEIFVNNTHIYPEFFNDGLEFELEKAIENMAKEMNVKKINSHVTKMDENIFKLYKDSGYEISDVYLSKKC